MITQIRVTPKKQEQLSNYFQQSQLFGVLDTSVLQSMIQRAKKVTYQRNEFIEIQKDSFYLIIDGQIQVIRNTREGETCVFGLLSANDYLGLYRLINDDGLLDYQYQALINVRLWKFTFNNQIAEIAKNTDFYIQLQKMLLTQLKFAEFELEHQKMQTSTQRFACYLLKESYRQQKSVITLSAHKSTIANRLGMTGEHFSRALKKLTVLGLVEANKNQFTLLNEEDIKEFCCESCSQISSGPCESQQSNPIKIM